MSADRVARRRRTFCEVGPGAPDLTPEQHERRGDAANALFRELVRCVREE